MPRTKTTSTIATASASDAHRDAVKIVSSSEQTATTTANVLEDDGQVQEVRGWTAERLSEVCMYDGEYPGLI